MDMPKRIGRPHSKDHLKLTAELSAELSAEREAHAATKEVADAMANAAASVLRLATIPLGCRQQLFESVKAYTRAKRGAAKP